MTQTQHTPEAFYFDPDFRSNSHPKNPTEPYCCRCQRNVDITKAIPVSINDETWMAVEGHDRHEEIRTNFYANQVGLVYNGWIGKDCRAAIAKATGAA